MLTLTTLVFITLAMKGGSYVYYFKNYVDKESLTSFIMPILNALSGVGINFFGEDPVSAGFGLFNAGGIIFMIVGITLSKRFADKYGKRDVFGVNLFLSTLFILFFLFLPVKICWADVRLADITWFLLWTYNTITMGNDRRRGRFQ
jgi:hypothetical protein